MILIPPAAVPCNVNVGLAALAGDAVADALVTMAASRLVSTTEPRIATSRRSFLSRTCMIVLPLCYLSFRPSDGSASISRHAGKQGNSRHRRRCRLSPERLPAHRHGGRPVRYYLALVRLRAESSSRPRSPLTKAPHSPGPKTRTGPAWSLLSRTATSPLGSWENSTQSPLAML